MPDFAEDSRNVLTCEAHIVFDTLFVEVLVTTIWRQTSQLRLPLEICVLHLRFLIFVFANFFLIRHIWVDLFLLVQP